MIKLHLDADTSRKALHKALVDRGHDVTRTPTSWIAKNASDEDQLLRATARGRAVFSFNIGDFAPLSARHPDHAGVILAAQSKWTLGELIETLDHLLSSTEARSLRGRVSWLSSWRRMD